MLPWIRICQVGVFFVEWRGELLEVLLSPRSVGATPVATTLRRCDGRLERGDEAGRSRAEAGLRRHRLLRRHSEPVAEGDDDRLGRRPSCLRRHPLAAHGREPAPEPARRDQRRRPDRAQGLALQGPGGAAGGRGRYEDGLALLHERGYDATPQRVRTVVVVRVERAAELVSPAYDAGATEDEVAARWEEHVAELRRVAAGA